MYVCIYMYVGARLQVSTRYILLTMTSFFLPFYDIYIHTCTHTHTYTRYKAPVIFTNGETDTKNDAAVEGPMPR